MDKDKLRKLNESLDKALAKRKLRQNESTKEDMFSVVSKESVMKQFTDNVGSALEATTQLLVNKIAQTGNDKLNDLTAKEMQVDKKITDEVNLKAKKGDIGDKGDKGEMGDRGDKGEGGGKGEKGSRGFQGIKGKDGKEGKIGKEGKQGVKGEDGSPDEPVIIRDKLESLDGDARLDAKAIKNLELAGQMFYGRMGGKKASGAWGGITGTLSDQTDLQTALDAKAATNQTMYIGTTSVAINRASAALTLAGITLTTPDIGTPSAGTLTNCTFPTLNQNTTGSAATLTTPRTIGGTSFDGSANIAVALATEATDTAAKTGTGSTYATNTSPTFVTPVLGTPTSGALTNCTALPAAQVAAGTFAGALEAADHGTAATDQIVNVAYGTAAAPAANTTTIGSLYITYTA